MRAQAPDPADASEAREAADALVAALRRLPEHERVATPLYCIGDYSQADGQTPVSTATAHSWNVGGPAVAQRLREAGAVLDLRDACSLGDVERVKELLAEAPERLHARSWGKAPLHIYRVRHLCGGSSAAVHEVLPQ